MEIDLTREAPAPLVDRHRRQIITVGALVIGLLAGGIVGAAIARRSGQDGRVVLTGIELVGGNGTVALHWSLANFDARVATVTSVRVAGQAVPIGSPAVGGKAVTDFSTPLTCGPPDPPQISVDLIDGVGESQELGFLPSTNDWGRLCH